MTTANEELIAQLRGQAYTTSRPDQLCEQAATLLQSQADRIAELEVGIKEVESKLDYWREKHADLGLKYDNLLQSFHIAETDAKLWKGTAEKARGDALEEAANHITPPEKMRRIDGRTYWIARVLADAIRALKGK